MSLTLIEARELITTKFQNEYNTTSIKWPNLKFNEPKDGSAWVGFNILFDQSNITTVSSKNNEQLGSVIVQVFTKVLTGTLENTTICDEVGLIFNRLLLSGISFNAPDVIPIATDSDVIWYQQNVRINFQYNVYVGP